MTTLSGVLSLSDNFVISNHFCGRQTIRTNSCKSLKLQECWDNHIPGWGSTHVQRLKEGPTCPYTESCTSKFLFGDPWVAWRLPLPQGVILASRDRVLFWALGMEPASPSACVSASLSLSLSIMNGWNKILKKKKKDSEKAGRRALVWSGRVLSEVAPE